MTMIKNITDGIGGFRAGELAVFSVGQNTGKSMYYNTNLCKEILLTGQKTTALIYAPYIPEIMSKEPKYKFSRKWYQAEFHPDNYFAVDAWCSQQFGPQPARPDAWSRWWHKFEYSILFRDEKDYVLFTLRWGI